MRSCSAASVSWTSPRSWPIPWPRVRPRRPDRWKRCARPMPTRAGSRARPCPGTLHADVRSTAPPPRPRGFAMTGFLGSVWWLIVSLGVLVTFHEFGHYWVARRNGVKVLRFSIGFGKPLWTRRGRDGTEWVIAAIPLGGYVKMLDEREAPVVEEQAGQAFNRKTVWQRIAIVVAGPLANLVLCVMLLWAMFVIGRPDYAPVVGLAEAVAAEAGLQRGDTINAVGERRTPTWNEVQMA